MNRGGSGDEGKWRRKMHDSDGPKQMRLVVLQATVP